MLVNKIFKTVLFISLTLLSYSLSAKIRLSTDRFDIHANETFHLILLVENQSTLEPNIAVDFLPEEFTLLNNQQFNNSALVNGKFSSQMGWNLKIISNTSGTFTLPSFKIGSEQSEPLHIRILPELDDLDANNQNSKIILRASVNLEEAYVQQQIIYTVRVYTSVATRHRNLSSLYAENALIEKLSDSKEFQLKKDDTIYNVLQEQYAVFPQKSGDLIIEPLTYKANILDESSSSWNSLNRVKPVSLTSSRYTVKVKPKPDNALEPWLPANELKISGQWQTSGADFSVGKPASYDLRIKGVGLLQSQLPSIEIDKTAGLKIYRDSPVMQSHFNRYGITSYHLEKLAIIPSESGEISFPEIKIPYWNTRTDNQDFAILPAFQIKVDAAEAEPALPAFVAQSDSQNQNGTIPAGNEVQSASIYWKISSFIFAGLWLLTLTWFVTRKATDKVKHSVDTNDSPKTPSNPKVSKKALSEAALTNKPKLCADLLLTWASQQPHLSSVSNLSQLIAFTENKQLKEQLELLQQALYARKPSQGANPAKFKNWKGSQLQQALQHLPSPLKKAESADKLPGLYD